MKHPAMHINDEDYTYRQISEALLYELITEDQPINDFLTDYDEYTNLNICYFRFPEIMANLLDMNNCPVFRKLVEIAVAFVSECQKPRYNKAGVHLPSSMKIADFLKEVFNRHHRSHG